MNKHTRYAARNLSTDESSWTGALNHMVVDTTLGILITGVGGAGVLTALVDTGLVGRAFGVLAASDNGCACNGGIAAVTWWTLADGAMVDTVALGVLTAGLERW